MSIVKKIRGLLGQQLLENTSGFKVIRTSASTSPWISEGEALALVPEGVQEVQFPVDVIGSDSIPATVQVSVIFTYAADAHKHFNFAYSVANSQHTGNYASVVQKALMSALSPKVAENAGAKEIAAMIKETALTVQSNLGVPGVTVTSIQLFARPRDAAVLASLGADKTQELVRKANDARHETRMSEVNSTARLRVAEHAEAMEAEGEAALLLAEKAKNALAQAQSEAKANSVRADQRALEAKALVESFGNDPLAYALYELAKSGNDLTITTDVLAAFRAKL